MENSEDIIVKCSLEEITQSFLKEDMIVWHDPDLNSQKNRHYIFQLEKICQVFTFTEWQKASSFIKEAHGICHVVTSETNGEFLVKQISENQSLSNIFIICKDQNYHSNWTTKYPKVSCIEIQIEHLLSQIQLTLLEGFRGKSSLKLNLPAFAPIFNDSDKSEMNNLHRYLKFIPKFKNRKQAKEDFVNLSKRVYKDPDSTLLITDFENSYNEYDKEQILRWYTIESFLYKITNNCLRIATSDSIQYCRFLLKDLQQAIKEQYKSKSKNFSGLLYRGAYLSDEEWLSLKENTGREIEMHGFLSVSRIKKIGLNFMKDDLNKKVFITIIVPKGQNEEEQGFAEIEEFSEFPGEKEILFNVRSRFTVLETEDEYSEELSYRHLVLLYGAQGFRRYLTEQNPVVEVAIPNTDNISCANCKGSLQKISGKYFFRSLHPEENLSYCVKCIDSAVKPLLFLPLTEQTLRTIKVKGCFLISPNNIPMYGYRCSQCGVKKQNQYFTCLDCNQNNRWCKNCFEKETASPTQSIHTHHSLILETSPFHFWFSPMSVMEQSHLKYQNESVRSQDNVLEQAEMYFVNNEYEKAIEFHNLYIQRNETKEKDGWLASSYLRIGSVFYEKGDFPKALEYAFKAHELFKSVYGENSNDFAITCNDIGRAYTSQREFEKALEYYFKSLEIHKAIYGENHPEVAMTENNIALVYDNKGEFDKALEYCFKALERRKLLYEENHPDIAMSLSNIGFIYDNSGEYRKALEYNSKALEVRKIIFGETHPLVAVSYSNAAVSFSHLRDEKTALEFHLRAFGIRRSLFKENHPDVAKSYSMIGVIYSNQGEFEKAIEYHSRSLSIKKIVYGGENHLSIARSYSDLGNVYWHQKEYPKAIEHYLNSLVIFKETYKEENHPDIARCYNDLGYAYRCQKDYQKGLEYSFKALELSGDNLNEVARAYYNIGLGYDSQREFEKSLEFHIKCLDIKKSLFGENHADVAASYVKMGDVYLNQGYYKKALEHYFKGVEIEKSLYGDTHKDVATSYNNIGYAYYLQGRNSQALEYYRKSLEIRQSLFGENHDAVALCYYNMGLVYDNQREYSKSLEFHMKFFEVKKSINGENHADVAASYVKTGNAYFNQREYNKALEQYLKGVEIEKSLYGEKHKNVASSYNNIGYVYYLQGLYKEALEYHAKSLEIRKSLFGENHAAVALCYNNLGLVYDNQKEYKKSVESHMKALEIKKFLYGENNADVALSYNNLALAYDNQEEYEKGLENHWKALNIRKLVLGEKDPFVGDSSRNIGYVYKKLGDYKKALEYHLKALEIYKLSIGENHPLTIKLQSRILEIQEIHQQEM